MIAALLATTVFVTNERVGMVLSPDESRLYAATGRGNSVAVIDTATHRVIATIPAGGGPRGVAIASSPNR